jgi:hypothetical protein
MEHVVELTDQDLNEVVGGSITQALSASFRGVGNYSVAIAIATNGGTAIAINGNIVDSFDSFIPGVPDPLIVT